MYAYVAIVIVTHWLLIFPISLFIPCTTVSEHLTLIFGLLAQVASRPSVQTHPAHFIAQHVVPIPLFSLLYCKAILLLLLLLAAMTYCTVKQYYYYYYIYIYIYIQLLATDLQFIFISDFVISNFTK